MRTQNTIAVALLLFATALALHWQAVGNGFVAFDDNLYVYENGRVLSGLSLENLRWSFAATHAANWHPLTWLSLMADSHFFGNSPRGFHATSVLLHGLNSALLFLVFARMTGAPRSSAMVAALFALHPLHVESVAWVSERKDVLSCFFFLLALWAYLRHVERPGLARYLTVLACFALGLMSKPMLVTFPCVLLLLDFWPLGRFSRAAGGAAALIREKGPFFVLSAFSCVVTVYAQKAGGAVSSLEAIPLGIRLANSVTAYAGYLWKCLWPSGLIAIYPMSREVAPLILAAALLVLASFSVLVFLQWRRRPYLATGWLWFLGTLVPVIGVVQVGVQAMADRYTYIPLIGIYLMICWGVSELSEALRLPKGGIAAVSLAVLVALSAVTHAQIGHWKDSRELFSHALRHSTGNFSAQNGLGLVLAGEGRIDEAIGHYTEALRANPEFALSRNNLGIALMMRGSTAEAIEQFAHAIKIKPEFVDARYNLGTALTKQARYREAVDQLQEALRMNPGDPDIQRNLAYATAALQRMAR